MGEWEREGRQAEQEEQDSSVIMGWQEQRENWTGGGGKNVWQDKNASSWLPIVKAPTQMCGRRVLSLFYLPMKNTNSWLCIQDKIGWDCGLLEKKEVLPTRFSIPSGSRPGEKCFSLDDGHGSLSSLPFSSAVSRTTGEGLLFHVTEWHSLARLCCCEVSTGWQSWSYQVAPKALTVPISKCLHELSMTVAMWD